MADALEAEFCEYTGCSPWMIQKLGANDGHELFGYFEDQTALDEAWTTLRADFMSLPEKVPTEEVCEQDWQNAYKAFLKPWKLENLHWVPVWMKDDYELPQGDVCVWFDAGMAFGTGSHETTRLCAQRLMDFRSQRGDDGFCGASIIDAGCGSGILSISAYLLGAKDVFGFDRDPEAVRVSLENSVFNGLPEGGVRYLESGIEPALENNNVDLILANIQADVLSIHASSFIGAIKEGGTLALSGILVKEKEKVITHFLDEIKRLKGVTPSWDSRDLGEWCDLVFKF